MWRRRRSARLVRSAAGRSVKLPLTALPMTSCPAIDRIARPVPSGPSANPRRPCRARSSIGTRSPSGCVRTEIGRFVKDSNARSIASNEKRRSRSANSNRRGSRSIVSRFPSGRRHASGTTIASAWSSAALSNRAWSTLAFNSPVLNSREFSSPVLNSPVFSSLARSARKSSGAIVPSHQSQQRRNQSRRKDPSDIRTRHASQRSDMQESPASILAISDAGSGDTFSPCF